MGTDLKKISGEELVDTATGAVLKAYVKLITGVDIYDKSGYDVVITSDKFSDQVKRFYTLAYDTRVELEKIIRHIVALELSHIMTQKTKLTDEETSYETKKQAVKEINEFLRYHDCSFVFRSTTDTPTQNETKIAPATPDANHETAKPSYDAFYSCNLYAIATPDGSGRYTFENRITKKRSGSFKKLADCLPIRLCKAPARKEAFLESRKKPKS